MSEKTRIDFIKAYFALEDKVKVDIPPTISKTSKGEVKRHFTGRRAGYDFKNGTAWVDRSDLHKFRDQYFIINSEEKGDNF